MNWLQPLAEQVEDSPVFLLAPVLPRLSLSQPQLQRSLQA